MGELADREPALCRGALADSCCCEGKPPTFVVASLTRCCVAASSFEAIALQALRRSVGRLGVQQSPRRALRPPRPDILNATAATAVRLDAMQWSATGCGGADERTIRAERARLAGLAAYKADDLKCAQVPRNSVVPGARGCKRGAS
jgi:hypothetical protein